MKNLEELVKVKSDSNKQEIVEFIQNKFGPISKEILIVENKENQDKSIIIGLNTYLAGCEPHCVIRTHRYS